MARQTTTVYGTRPLVDDLELKHKKKYTYGLNYPFTKPANQKKGAFFIKSWGLTMRRSNVLQLLKTNPGERVMLPGFGAGLARFLFEQMNEDNMEDMEEAVRESLTEFMPEIEVISIDIGPSNEFEPQTGITPHNIEYNPNTTVRMSILLRNKDLQDIFVVYADSGAEQVAVSIQTDTLDMSTYSGPSARRKNRYDGSLGDYNKEVSRAEEYRRQTW